MRRIKIAPPNSILFIEDVDGGAVPTADKPPAILWNHRCISVGTLMENDGETTVKLGHLSEIAKEESPSFDGVIETPTGTVCVSVVPDRVVLQDGSGSPRTRIVIWTNHPTEPDEIVIGFERA